MAPASMGPLLRHLRKVSEPSSCGASDAELLDRFVRRHDEIAFELLVWRHQRMVLGVCRRVLRDAHAAEDAFQATFLALVRKAGSAGRRGSVAGWLHTVAFHVALRARKREARWTSEDLAPIASTHDPAAEATRRDVASVLDEEVSRLPQKYRLPVVLCYLEGKTYPEAGRQLGLPVGTLSARLTRARALLRTRLSRRGIKLSAAILAAVLCEQAAEASAPAALVRDTIGTTAAMVAGQKAVPAAVAVLADGALRSMSVGKLKMLMAVLLAGILATGAGLLVPARSGDPASPPESPKPPPAAAPNREKAAHVDRLGDPLPAGALFRFGSMRWRHPGGIRNSALSADGKRLATVGGSSVIVWNLAAGVRLRRFACEGVGQFATPGIAFSPDGKYLGYVHNMDFACVWDVTSGEEVARFAGHQRHRSAVCRFTPSGEQFILDDGRRLVFWDLRTKKEVRSIALEHVQLLSDDAKTWVFADERSTVRFGDVRDGKETGRLDLVASNNGIENGVALSPDGQTLAVVHRNKEIQLRDFPGGAWRASFLLPDAAKYRLGEKDYWEYCVSFSADGRTLLLATKAGVIHRWDLRTRKELPPLSKHAGAASSAHTLPDGKTTVTTGTDGLVRLWESRTGRALTEPSGYVGRIHAAYSPDGRLAAVGDERGRLDLWDARSGRVSRILRREGPAVWRLAFTPDGKSLAETGPGESTAVNVVRFWDVSSGEEKRVLRFDAENGLFQARSLTFSPDGRRLLIGDCQRPRLCELSTGADRWRGDFYFEANVFSRDGKTVFVASGPFLLFLDAASGKVRSRVRLKTELPDNMGAVVAMVLSPDGRRLALGLHTGKVLLCDTQTGEEQMRFAAIDPPGPIPFAAMRLGGANINQSVWGLSFSPDGRWLSTSGADNSVRLWEVVTGREVLRLPGHEGWSSGVTFASHGRTVLSWGADAQAYLWLLRPPREQGAKRSLDSLWASLADEPAKAYRALWALSEADGAAAFLRDKLSPVKPVAEDRLRKLIADLDSDQFTVREDADKALAALDELAVPAMRKALAGKPPLETRKRLEELVKRVESRTLTSEQLRIERAIDVLARMETHEAKRILQILADGAPGALTTTAAEAALKRSR